MAGAPDPWRFLTTGSPNLVIDGGIYINHENQIVRLELIQQL